MNDIQELLIKVAGDSVLKTRYAMIIKEAEAAGKEATEEKLETFAKDAGYSISIEKYKTYLQELSRSEKQGELSDAELDMVAGGKTTKDLAVQLFMTVLSLGIGCLEISILAWSQQKTCVDGFDTNSY